MVKLQKHVAYKYNNRKHYKHIVIIPEEMIDELGWKDGVELVQQVENDHLILKPIKKNEKEVRFEA